MTNNNFIEVSYKNMNDELFSNFIFNLEHTTEVLLTKRLETNTNGIETNILKTALGFFKDELYFFSSMEFAHNTLQKFEQFEFRQFDSGFINSLSKYNLKHLEQLYSFVHDDDIAFSILENRIKKDIVLLLCICGGQYYVHAHNDTLPHYVNGLYHIEGYKHLLDGIKFGIKNKNLKLIADESDRLKILEIYRRRSAGIININQMILLYLYSNFRCFNNLELSASAIEWLFLSGYEGFLLPPIPQEDHLVKYASMSIPEVGFAFPKDMHFFDIYEKGPEYKNILLSEYPDADENLKYYIGEIRSLPERCWEWR